METPDRVQSTPPALTAALDHLWRRFLPEIEERIAVLDSAAAAVEKGTLTAQQQQAALAAAHKLAGALGSFGLGDGTAPARETEQLYALNQAPSPEKAAQLAGLAAALRSLVEARKRRCPAEK